MISMLSHDQRPMGGLAGSVWLVCLGLSATLFLGCAAPEADPQPPTASASPAGEGSAQPNLSVSQDGTVVLSWLEPGADGYALKYPARTLAEGSDWFVNWADIPSVVPLTDELWAAHWLVTQTDGYGYDIVMSISDDAGATWPQPVPLNLDGTPTEHGFVTLFPWVDGMGAVWLDGRNFMVDGAFEYYDTAGNPLGTNLRYALFGRDGERLLEEELDAMVCDCCQTDVAISGGEGLLIYRDRTPEEVRDIVVQRLSDGPRQAPVPLSPDNWVIGGCPINGPAIDARGDNVVAAWFSAVEEVPLVHLTRSADGGQTFGDAVEIDAGGSFGHVDVAALANGESVVSWLRSEGDGLALTMRKVSRSGELGAPMTVALIDIARPLDFPQMAYDGSRLIFAWTDFEDSEQVKTAVVELAP